MVSSIRRERSQMRAFPANFGPFGLIFLLSAVVLANSQQANNQQEENARLQAIAEQMQSPLALHPMPTIDMEQIDNRYKEELARRERAREQQEQQQYQQEQQRVVITTPAYSPEPLQPPLAQQIRMQLAQQQPATSQPQQQQILQVQQLQKPQTQQQQQPQQPQQPEQQQQQQQSQQSQQPQQQQQHIGQMHQPIMQYPVPPNAIPVAQREPQREPTSQQSLVPAPPPPPPSPLPQISRQQPLSSYSASNYHQSNSPLYLGHNPFIEILRPNSYADDNIVTLNLSHSHIYEIDSDAFVGQRFEHIDLSNNKLGLIHSRSFRIGPNHSRHNPYNPHSNSSKQVAAVYPTRRPPPAHPKSVTIDFSHNPAIVALSGAFDHIDVPNCLLNFTNSTVELKFGAFKKYFKEHPGHIIDIESVDCCEQEWLLGYKHNFVPKTRCEHDPTLILSKLSQQTIIDSCIAYVTSARHSMTIQGPSVIHQVAAAPRGHSNSHSDNQYTTYLILGGTAMILTSLSIYIIFYMFSLKAAFVYQMQNKS